MSPSLNVLLLLLFGIALVFIIIKRMRSSHRRPVHLSPEDQHLQDIYDKNKHTEDKNKNLTLQERVELSWAFLANITEQVIKHFPAKDKQKVDNAGQILTKNGTKYQHSVDQQLNMTQEVVKAKSKGHRKDQSISR